MRWIVFFELILSFQIKNPEHSNICCTAYPWNQEHLPSQSLHLPKKYSDGLNPIQVLLWHFNRLHNMNPSSLISKPTVHFPARTCRLLRIRRRRNSAWATAASSCGRCASLCSWWLGRWSSSARPEPHPAAPAPSRPPGPGSWAASASVQSKYI